MFLFSVRMRESFGLHTATVLAGERRDAVCDTLRTVIRGGAKDSGASGRVGRGCARVCVRVFDMPPSESPSKRPNKNACITE